MSSSLSVQFFTTKIANFLCHNMCAGVRSARVRLDDLLKDLSKKTEERYISLLSNLLLKYFYERRNN